MARKKIVGKKQLTANLLGWVYQALKDDALDKGYSYKRLDSLEPKWGDYFKAIALGVTNGDIKVPQKKD